MMSKPASVSAISDVLALIGKRGWLSPPLISIVTAPKPISSRALTFRLEMGDEGPGLIPLYEALSNNLASRSIVLDAQRIDGAVWGEILATAALNAEISAALIFGSARDRSAIQSIGIPTYGSREIVVGPAGRAHVREVGGMVTINAPASVNINQDDIIVCDESGCVVIPQAIAESVLIAAAQYEKAESTTVGALKNHEPLTTAYIHKKMVVERIVSELKKP